MRRLYRQRRRLGKDAVLNSVEFRILRHRLDAEYPVGLPSLQDHFDQNGAVGPKHLPQTFPCNLDCAGGTEYRK